MVGSFFPITIIISVSHLAAAPVFITSSPQVISLLFESIFSTPDPFPTITVCWTHFFESEPVQEGTRSFPRLLQMLPFLPQPQSSVARNVSGSGMS